MCKGALAMELGHPSETEECVVSQQCRDAVGLSYGESSQDPKVSKSQSELNVNTSLSRASTSP